MTRRSLSARGRLTLVRTTKEYGCRTPAGRTQVPAGTLLDVNRSCWEHGITTIDLGPFVEDRDDKWILLGRVLATGSFEELMPLADRLLSVVMRRAPKYDGLRLDELVQVVGLEGSKKKLEEAAEALLKSGLIHVDPQQRYYWEPDEWRRLQAVEEETLENLRWAHQQT